MARRFPKRLDTAIAARDRAELDRIARLGANTDVGARAALLLSYLHLDLQEPLEAVGWLRQLTEDAVVRDHYEPQVSILLALAASQAEMRGLAEETVASVRTRHPKARLRLAGQEVGLLDLEHSVLAIRSLSEHARETESERAWLLHPGDRQRDANAAYDLEVAGVGYDTRCG